jgi:hypothetical protein
VRDPCDTGTPSTTTCNDCQTCVAQTTCISQSTACVSNTQCSDLLTNLHTVCNQPM